MQIPQARPGNDDHNHDKFSELPLPVFHHILSFLRMNDVARLCIVSPRCRELCTSRPDMLFDVNFDEYSCTNNCKGLRGFLHKLLDEQDGSELLQMHQFRLHWHCNDCRDFSPTSLFHRWVNRAVSCNAQEIDIGFFPAHGGFFNLPVCLSRASTTTRILRLKLWGCQLNCLPIDFASIQVLSLNSIVVSSGCLLGEWVSRHFASLKTLNLEEVRLCEHLSITSSSLQCLTMSRCLMKAEVSTQCPSLKYHRIEGCRMKLKLTIDCGELKSLLVHDCRFNYMRFSIVCPSLKDLQICRCSFKYSMIYNIWAEALCTLFMDITLGPTAFMLGSMKIDPCSVQIMERVTLKLSLDLQTHVRLSLLEFFRNLSDIHLLEIDIDTIKIMDLKEMGIVFPNVHHLEVTVANLQDMSLTDIATFVIAMCSASVGLRTVTLNYNDCGSDNVVRLLKSALEFMRREIPAVVEINCLERPMTLVSQDAAVRYSKSWSK